MPLPLPPRRWRRRISSPRDRRHRSPCGLGGIQQRLPEWMPDAPPHVDCGWRRQSMPRTSRRPSRLAPHPTGYPATRSAFASVRGYHLLCLLRRRDRMIQGMCSKEATGFETSQPPFNEIHSFLINSRAAADGRTWRGNRGEDGMDTGTEMSSRGRGHTGEHGVDTRPGAASASTASTPDLVHRLTVCGGGGVIVVCRFLFD